MTDWRVWMPTITRESAFSAAAWVKVVQLRVEPAGTAVVEVMVIGSPGSSPNTLTSAARAAKPAASAMFMSANIRAVFQMFLGRMARAVRARRFQPTADGSYQK